MGATRADIYAPIIEDNLFQALNPILSAAKDDSNYLMSNPKGETVYIPQAGSNASVSHGNSTYPVTVTERTDSTVTYDLTNIEIEPVRYGRFDEETVSYDYKGSLLNDATGAVGAYAAKYIMSQWYHKTTDQYVETTGDTTYTSTATGSTDVVKALTLANIIEAAQILDKQHIPSNDRYLIIPTAMYYSLFDDITATDYLNAATRIMETGKIDTIHGFKLITQPTVCNVTSTYASARTPDSAGATGDLSAALAVYKPYASYAIGSINVYDNPDESTYYGGVMSADLFVGGKYRRTGKEGVVPIIEQAN